MKRQLGRSSIEVSAMGMGCWAIGGPWIINGNQAGWGEVDDEESLRAIRRALDLGITFFDTAANYGAGHSERISTLEKSHEKICVKVNSLEKLPEKIDALQDDIKNLEKLMILCNKDNPDLIKYLELNK